MSTTVFARQSVSFVSGVAAFAALSLAWISGASADQAITTKFTAHKTAETQTVDHAAWTKLLQAYVKESPDGVNRVDYAAFKSKSHGELKKYVSALEAVDPRLLNRPEQFAYWANLYNAKTIDVVLDHYPVKSIREISINEGIVGFFKKSVGAGGPWKTPVVTVAGTPLSLDNIEHQIMRPVFKDPRVHYAVNCASYGCPNLQREAFTGTDLETQLDAGARAFINHPRGISVQDGKVKASSIYNWFQVDFGGNAKGVLDHARKYAEADLASAIENATSIDTYAYDWALNDVAPPVN